MASALPPTSQTIIIPFSMFNAIHNNHISTSHFVLFFKAYFSYVILHSQVSESTISSDFQISFATPAFSCCMLPVPS